MMLYKLITISLFLVTNTLYLRNKGCVDHWRIIIVGLK